MSRIGTSLSSTSQKCCRPIFQKARRKIWLHLVNRAQRSPRAVTLINEVLAAEGTSIATLMANALADQFDYIERIDHLTTIAENRRNAALREIDRRRAVLAETVRRTVREIEDGEFSVIETTPAKGKNAA